VTIVLPETSTAEVSSGHSSRSKTKLLSKPDLRSRIAARRDSAVHVSLSSYSPVKQPGINVIPPSEEPESRRSPTLPIWDRKLGHCLSEELRRRAVAPRRRRAEGRYIGLGPLACQHLRTAKIRRPGPVEIQPFPTSGPRPSSQVIYGAYAGWKGPHTPYCGHIPPPHSSSLWEVSIRGESRQRHGIFGVRRHPTIVQKTLKDTVVDGP
jgi:hypothetical protein